jgi:hypothetical protein
MTETAPQARPLHARPSAQVSLIAAELNDVLLNKVIFAVPYSMLLLQRWVSQSISINARWNIN